MEAAKEHLAIALGLMDNSKRSIMNRRPFDSKANADTKAGARVELLETAVNHLRRAITLCPHMLELYHTVAEAYELLLDTSSAVSNLRYALRINNGFETRHRLAMLLFARSQSWMATNDFTKAEKDLEECTRLRPVDAGFWKCLAKARVSQGHTKFKETLTALDQTLSLDSSDGEALILRGKINWAVGQQEAGNKDMFEAGKLEPEHPEVEIFHRAMFEKSNKLYGEAKQAMKSENYPGAVASLTAALSVTPDDVKLLVLRAAANRKCDNHDAAIEDLDDAAYAYFEAITNFKPTPNVHGKVSPDDARRELERAFLAAPPWKREPFQVTRQRSLVFNDVALQLMQAGQYKTAITTLNKAINGEMNLVEALRRRQMNYLSDDQSLKGSPSRNTNQDDTDTRTVSSYMGRSERSLHANQGSVDTASTTVSLHHDVDYRFFVNRGDCYRALEKIELALADYHRAYDAKPGNWDTRTRLSMVHYIIGTALFNHSAFDEAEVELSTAIQYNPKVAHYFAVRGKACYYQHKFDLAHADYREALLLDPSLEDVRVRLLQFEPNGETLRSSKQASTAEPTGGGPQFNTLLRSGSVADSMVSGSLVLGSNDSTSQQQPSLQTLVPPGHGTHPPFVATHAEHASSVHAPHYAGTASVRAERPPSLLPVLHQSYRGAVAAHKEAKEYKQAVQSLQSDRPEIKRDPHLWQMMKPRPEKQTGNVGATKWKSAALTKDMKKPPPGLEKSTKRKPTRAFSPVVR